MAAAGDPATVYRARLAVARAEAGRLEERSRRLSWARLAVALAAVGFLGTLLARAASPPGWALAGAAVSVVVFALLATVHARVLREIARHRELVAIQEAALARLGRVWGEAPQPAAPEPPTGSAAALARDLDLFGRASLFQLLGTAWTPPGRATLAGWLLAAAAGEDGESAIDGVPEPQEIAARQQAVRELAFRLDARQELERAARRLAEAEPDPERFLAWCEGGRWALARPGWAWASRLLPLAALGGLGAAVFGLVPWGLALVPLLVNFSLIYGLRHRLEEAFSEVDVGAADALAYSDSLRAAAETAAGADAPRLGELVEELQAGGEPAWRWLAHLRRGLEIADARHGSFHFIPQTFVLWDLHALRRLDRWRAAVGEHARRWLEALGELEALAALAGLAHDQPAWAFAEVGETAARDDGPALAASALGHPLLADSARVANDVAVGPPGTFLLVTGSNMAGKSTLLRAIGVNAVLAQAGGPACAAELSLPPLALATSMRTDDSLAAGVSRFMAEALRIRAVVAAAEAARAPEHGPPARAVLYLLDEALAGTNARERQAAMRRVVARLLAAGAIGAVAGHDLELADTPELAAAARPVHFRETLHPGAEGGPRMTFDYRLREGLATTSNALELMELLGLGGEAPEEPLGEGGRGGHSL